MRRHASWMTELDERILEFLNENGNHQPGAIRERLDAMSADMDYSDNYVNMRCRKLRDYGLLVNVGGGVYSITDDGRAFLAGELDAGTLDDPTEE